MCEMTREAFHFRSGATRLSAFRPGDCKEIPQTRSPLLRPASPWQDQVPRNARAAVPPTVSRQSPVLLQLLLQFAPMSTIRKNSLPEIRRERPLWVCHLRSLDPDLRTKTRPRQPIHRPQLPSQRQTYPRYPLVRPLAISYAIPPIHPSTIAPERRRDIAPSRWRHPAGLGILSGMTGSLRNILICSCEGTMPLDTDTLRGFVREADGW
jgi:hypothetical protein